MTENKIENKIILTQEDARVYLIFRANREKFLALYKSGIFDLDTGRAEVNCHNNQIQSVSIHRTTYKRASGSATIPI